MSINPFVQDKQERIAPHNDGDSIQTNEQSEERERVRVSVGGREYATEQEESKRAAMSTEGTYSDMS